MNFLPSDEWSSFAVKRGMQLVAMYILRCREDPSCIGWTNDERMMIACCNDGTRPVIFKIERIDIPENRDEEEWLSKQNFKNTADNAYTG